MATMKQLQAAAKKRYGTNAFVQHSKSVPALGRHRYEVLMAGSICGVPYQERRIGADTSDQLLDQLKALDVPAR